MTKKSVNPSPNLFNYATKELSQDAMICWLIAWAGENKSDDLEKEELRRCGREFVHALLNHRRKKHIELPEEIVIEIYQQDKGIDVLARINEQHVLLIEDKTDTQDHSGQLERYYGYVAGGHTKKLLGKTATENIYPIYFKTGNQSLEYDRRIERVIEGDNGYWVFHRKDFLSVLDGYKGNNPILMDFRQYLQKIESDTNGYQDWTKDSPKSSWLAWEGFYRCLECDEHIKHVFWCGYVPNPQGGFLSFAWRPDGAKHPLYLQLDNVNKYVSFKVDAEQEESNEEKDRLKWHWHNLIMQAGNQQNKPINKPRRMRIGSHMTVGIWEEEDWMVFDQDDNLDILGTVENLKHAESVLIAAANAE